VLRQALTQLLRNQYSVQIVSEHHLKGKMTEWPLIVVPGWSFLEPAFRDELAEYGRRGGRVLLIGEGPAKLFAAEMETAQPAGIVAVDGVGDDFAAVLGQVFPDPVVKVTGSHGVDVSLRTLGGRLAVHLVNTSGPHGNAPDGGIQQIDPVGPLTVMVRLREEPKSITMQPEGELLDVTWEDGRATVTVPSVALYSILEIGR